MEEKEWPWKVIIAYLGRKGGIDRQQADNFAMKLMSVFCMFLYQ
jgi:hypothetical protein